MDKYLRNQQKSDGQTGGQTDINGMTNYSATQVWQGIKQKFMVSVINNKILSESLRQFVGMSLWNVWGEPIAFYC